MLDLNDLPDNAIVTITVNADPADTPASPSINGRAITIPNNVPTPVLVPYALVLLSSSYKITVERDEDGTIVHELTENGLPANEPTDSDAPSELGGRGAEGSAPENGSTALETDPPAFDPTPVLDGNAETSIARVKELTTADQLVATKTAEEAKGSKARKSVLEAIDVALVALLTPEQEPAA